MFVKKEGHTDMPLLIGFNVKKRKSTVFQKPCDCRLILNICYISQIE